MIFPFAGEEFINIGFDGNGLARHAQTIRGLYMETNPNQRIKNVAFTAFLCATVPVLSEGGPAKWLKNKNLSNHLIDFEPGGRPFESGRAHNLLS